MDDFQLILINFFKNINNLENKEEYCKRLDIYCCYDCFGSCDVCPIKTDCNYYDPDHVGGGEDVETETLFAIVRNER